MTGKQHEAGSLLGDLGRLLASGEGADFTLLVGSSHLAAHSFILGARSPVFAAMLRHNMQESSSRSVDIPDMEEQVARQLLSFIYIDEVPLLSKLAPQLLVASDKYNLPLLKKRCEQQLELDLCVGNVGDYVVLAMLHSCSTLKELSLKLIRAHTREVMGTEGWQKGLCKHPQLVAEVSHLVATPLSSLQPSKNSTPAPSGRGPTISTWSQSIHIPAADAAAPPTVRHQLRQPFSHDAACNYLQSLSQTQKKKKFFVAAENGRVGEMRALLAAGAHVGMRDRQRKTALHWAAVGGSEGAVTCLLDAGAAVNARDRGQATPLHWAAGNGHIGVVWLLIEASADLNAEDGNRRTPLHDAAIFGSPEVVVALLEMGADKDATDDRGDKPVDLVSGYDPLQLVDIISGF